MNNSVSELEKKKAIVIELYEKVIAGGDIARADTLLTPNYIQHNPHVPSGRGGFKLYFSSVHKRFRIKLKILSVIAEGDMVVIHVEQKISSRFINILVLAMDRFRIENGQVAEHWDVMSGQGFFDRLVLELAA
jgi:predicted SnoaL-like aldol condensation-catalyzing enzyme